MKISVFMPSYNKGGFAVEAVQSVIAQDDKHKDWELWLMENSTDTKTRKLLKTFALGEDPRIKYLELDLGPEIRDYHAIAPYLMNKYYRQATGDIIMYLSDDDLFMPYLFRFVSDHFEDHPLDEAVYFDMARTNATRPGTGTTWSEAFASICASVPRVKGHLYCQVDGGQVAYRKSVLSRLPEKFMYDELGPQARACDGLHLEDIAEAGVVFQPLPYRGLIHRHTKLSLWN